MKTLKLGAMILLIGMLAVSCKKEVVGPAGPAGVAGTNGTNGTNGNADVKVFGYGQAILNSGSNYSVTYVPTGLTTGMIDSSAILVYYSAGMNMWNMANGAGPNTDYNTVLYTTTAPDISVYLRNPDGTYYNGVDVTWDSVRVIIIPGTTFNAINQNVVNLNDYHSVSDYFSKK